jgi:hypothetical protein
VCVFGVLHRNVLEGALRAQAFFLLQDPWANAYNPAWNQVASLPKGDRILGEQPPLSAAADGSTCAGQCISKLAAITVHHCDDGMHVAGICILSCPALHSQTGATPPLRWYTKPSPPNTASQCNVWRFAARNVVLAAVAVIANRGVSGRCLYRTLDTTCFNGATRILAY